ncbi:unnamed protein product [Lymnaea stagnalis]|uniref:HYR domain-containing protein n=1 Tax=Lymnaea stagnalis TaxID=6523 RepID=A0AAV2ILB5_LYMST
MDTDKQRLFWTGYTHNGSGVIARLHLQRGKESYHEIMEGLNNPRAIHLVPDKKIIFWTEYGGKSGPACVQRAKISGRNPKMLMSHRLFWPNGLATHHQTLFVADGAGKVFSMDFEGENQQELSYLTGPALHIFGLYVMDTVLFYSDWYTNSVYMVNRVTGKIDTIVSHLSRPTSIAVYHPTNLTVLNQCSQEGKRCTQTCVPVPRSFHCTCAVGSKLASDGFTCITMVSPWEVTEESKCDNQCHDNAYCSQLVPLLEYQCVCKAGYEGDGLRCSECGEDFYKPLLGNDTCYPCPPGASTQASKTATQCFCEDPQLSLINGVCSDATTTVSTTIVSTSPPIEIVTDRIFAMTTPDEDDTTELTESSAEEMPGLPSLSGCPHGAIMKMKLPETSNKIFLPINWTARDGFGRDLQMISNFGISDNKIIIPWIANGNGGQHTIVFEAKDNWMQVTTCQFQVFIEDTSPPRFSNCPQSIEKKTSMNSEPISWIPPIAMDNAHDPIVSSTHEPKSEFQIGTTVITYTALDLSGNMANCTFNVTLIYEQPCNLPEMKNGVFICESGDSDICHIACNEGYISNPLGMFPRPFSCLVESDIQNLLKIMKKREPCLKQRRPTKAHQEFSLAFNGPCRPNSTSIKAILKEKVISKLEEKRLCYGAICTHSPIAIVCGPVFKRRRYAEEKFNMTWNVTIEYAPKSYETYTGFSPGQVKQIVTDMKFELKKLAAHLNFFHEEENFSPVPSSINAKDFQWLCQHGEMKILDGCVPCPPGSHLNESEDRCVLCAEGYYQNSSSTTQCLLCPQGATLELGALTEAECVVFPAINEMSKFLIITACSFALIFLCMVFFMYLQYHHQHKHPKEEKKIANNSRYLTANVYAHPPVPNEKCPDYIRTSTRDFMMGTHDYEDIDGQHKSTFETFSRRPPGCGDSLSSFKAHTDMTFLQTGSPNSSSLRTSDETLMPNSPRESAKSFNLYGDGGFQYTISPNGTMGSFKGSPPSSPYRSLRLTANGPIPRGPSESPTPNTPTLNSLLGDESPYTSRLIRDRLIDPDSPYRIISHDRRTGSESPYKMTRRPDSDSPHHMLSLDTSNHNESPYRMVGKESPYRSPALQRELAQSFNRAASDMGMRSPSYPQVIDAQSSLRSMPETSSIHRQMTLPRDEGSAFMPVGDFLYKRPPSPLSPPISSRKSNDSLQRSPSTPRASPGMSRKRIENPYRTPPMNQRRKGKNEFGIYEYEYD